MKIIESILKGSAVTEYYKKSLKNNWLGTAWENYVWIDSRQKGSLGEIIVEQIMKEKKHKVKPPTNAGHDRIIDKRKTEIKFSLANSNTRKDGKLIDPDSFIINHISVGKDWDSFIFCGINPKPNNARIRKKGYENWPEYRIYIMDKDGLRSHLRKKNTYPFSRQQGGKKGNNDDWMVAGRVKCLAFFALPFVREYKGVL